MVAKRVILTGWIILLICAVVAALSTLAPAVAADSAACIDCHETVTPGVVAQWKKSAHSGKLVACLDCHEAKEGDKDGFEHNGRLIAVIVSPLDCSRCHEKEFNEQKGSHHAKAGQILGSLDNMLGEVVGGMPAVNAGCRQCHGSAVLIGKDGRPTPETWPNTGMGRINPDGSWGSCSACHARHEFSKAQARQPESCGKCHLGPDHPQIEVWNESKHGIMYHANRDSMNLDKASWKAGVDYFSGPTCASCHMSAAGGQGVTHDIGERISWTLRPPISAKLNMIVFEDDTKEDVLGDAPELPTVGTTYKTKAGDTKKVKAVLDWKKRRANMQDICAQCHSPAFVKAAYTQFDDVVDLYDTKFAKPAKAIMDELKATGKITKEDFDDEIEWTWWELWHHEGRRARHAAAMQGPDYLWWHGIYDVAKHFYTEFIPQLREVAGDEEAERLLGKYVYSQPGHLWYKEGMSKESLKKIQEYYKERYSQ